MSVELESCVNHEAGSRELKLRLKGADGVYKSFKTPSFFPTIARIGDLRDVMDAKRKLEVMRPTHNLPHLNGLIVEAHSIPQILDDQLRLTRQTKLVAREAGQKFTHIYDCVNEYGFFFIIDPNLDRINRPKIYGDGFQKLHSEYKPLGKDFFTQDILGRLRSQAKVTTNLFSNPDFITKVLRLQQKYKADVFLPPYSEINLRNFDEDLNINLDLYRAAEQINKFVFGEEKTLVPVLCLNTNVLKLGAKKSGDNEWEKITKEFVNLNSSMIILKITNFNTLSKNENYREILQFFQKLKTKTNKPTLFLNMNEFSYVLVRSGLDIFSSRMSRSGLDVPVAPLKKPSLYGKYYVPRKMVLVNFEELEELPCACPFCQPLNDGDHKNLSAKEWNSLRIYHFVHEKDRELGTLITEMRKSSLRPALMDMFADSEDWKNFTTFI